jgi:hypothetical protein
MKFHNMRFIGSTTLLLAATLCGCTTTTHAVGCGATNEGWSQCMARASRICGTNGYDVVKRSDGGMAVPSAAEMGDGFDQPGANATDRWMVVSCKQH